MFARAKIGIWMSNETIRATNLDDGGDPFGAGAILAVHYTNRHQVNELINLGDLFVLGSKIKPDPGKPHSLINPQPCVTIAFTRDEGKPYCPPSILYSLNDYVALGEKDISIDYLYLFCDGR